MLPGVNFPWKISLNLSKFCQAKLNVFLFRFLPFWLSRWYLSQIGKVYYFLKRREKALIQATIRHIFGADLEPGSIRTLIKAAFQGITDHYHEKLFVAYSNFPQALEVPQKQYRTEGRGRNAGNFGPGPGDDPGDRPLRGGGISAGALSVRGYPTTMICRFQTNRLRESLHQRAEAVGLQLVDPEDGNVFVAAIKALKSGRILITECDEFDEWRPAAGSKVTFLNSPLTGDKTLDILQKRSRAPVVTALMQRTGKKKYTLNFTPVFPNPSEGEAAGKACLKVLEASIQASPAHWYQWKKFGQMLDIDPEVLHDHQKSGHLAHELQVPVPV